MTERELCVAGLRERYRRGVARPGRILEKALGRANSNAGRNVYLAQDAAWSRGEAGRLRVEEFEGKALWGVPLSLKDCFDLAGFVTTCGAKVLRDARGVAVRDSAVAARLRACGAVITGKTHMQQLAYGITGENQDFGDSVQPGDAGRLTGGSSSGAAASVMEGSAVAAIGTDTGGSIRVPAALCGLVGYRASVSLGAGLWEGGEHLAESFDTLGWLYRDAVDGPALGAALFGLAVAEAEVDGLKVGVPAARFMEDCEAEVQETLEGWIAVLRGMGADVRRFDGEMWREAMEIFAPIQASEAARLHPEPRDGFETAIAERLRWGASIGEAEVMELRGRLAEFRRVTEERLRGFDVVLMPCTPTVALRAGEDQSGARRRILRYTTPVSLMGWPAVTLPGGRGAPQLVGKAGEDAKLLGLSARLGESSG